MIMLLQLLLLMYVYQGWKTTFKLHGFRANDVNQSSEEVYQVYWLTEQTLKIIFEM